MNVHVCKINLTLYIVLLISQLLILEITCAADLGNSEPIWESSLSQVCNANIKCKQ